MVVGKGLFLPDFVQMVGYNANAISTSPAGTYA
jgi:hypothetical protein